MNRTWILAGAAALASTTLLFSACGDGPDAPPPTSAPVITATPRTGASVVGTAATTTGTPAPTRAPNDYGPAPIFGANVKKVSPEWGTKVQQASTRSPDSSRPGGICAEVSFAGLPENVLWFRMAVNGVEVTQELTWVAASQQATEAKMCFAPDEGLPTGRMQVAIVVQNPNNVNEPTREVVAWEFDVT